MTPEYKPGDIILVPARVDSVKADGALVVVVPRPDGLPGQYALVGLDWREVQDA